MFRVYEGSKNFMGDIEKTGEDTANADHSTEGAHDTEKGADEKTTVDETAADGGADDKNKDGKGAEIEKDKDGKPVVKPAPVVVDDEPKARKRNVDFIHDRQAKKAEKDAAKKDADANKDTTVEDDEDDIDPEDKDLIDGRVNKILKPIIDREAANEDKQEIATFVAANPDFKPYADKVFKYAQHASRRNIPLEALFYEVAGPDLLKIGADRARSADKEANKTQAGGGSDQGGGGAEKNVWDLTPEEFAIKQQEVRSKPRG